MTATSEVPASFRSSSLRPGPLALVKGGIREVLSRRRLIAYLVRADLRKAGTDTLLGNLWWVLDPLLQMLVYVIFVGIILGRGSIEDYPLFVLCAILPWKWFSEAVGEGTAAVVGRERLIKQIYFPKLVLPVATTSAGVVSFAFGLIPLFAITLLLLQRPPVAVGPPDPGRRLRPVRVLDGLRDLPARRPTSSTATSATCPGTCSGCGSTCRRPCTPPSRSSR